MEIGGIPLKSFLRILGALLAIVGFAAALAYVTDDIDIGLLALFAIPAGVLACLFIYGLILHLINAARGVQRVGGRAGGKVAKTANRGIYAVSGFNISAALRRVADRWKESE